MVPRPSASLPGHSGQGRRRTGLPGHDERLEATAKPHEGAERGWEPQGTMMTMKTLTTTWLAQIVAVAVLMAAGSASASSGLLSGNTPLGKNTLEGGYYQVSASVSAETHQGCGEVSRW